MQARDGRVFTPQEYVRGAVVGLILGVIVISADRLLAVLAALLRS